MATISVPGFPPSLSSWENGNPNPSSPFLPPPDEEPKSQSLEYSPSPPSLQPKEEEGIADRSEGDEPPADPPSAQDPCPNISSTPSSAPPAAASSSLAPPPAAEPAPSLIHLSFNQDQGCFAVGTDHGFRIYNCDPFREIFRRDFDGGGIGVVEMLFRCNILAIVGGGPQPHYPPNKVMIWDDHQSRCIGELSFRSEVRAVRLRRDRIVVVLDHKIFVYNFADLKLVHQIETVPNPKGLCAVSQQQGSLVLVCPGGQKGQVRVEHYGARRTKFIMAHDSRIACFALSQDGRLIATASTKGTLIRIFNTVDGTLLQEVSYLIRKTSLLYSLYDNAMTSLANQSAALHGRLQFGASHFMGTRFIELLSSFIIANEHSVAAKTCFRLALSLVPNRNLLFLAFEILHVALTSTSRLKDGFWYSILLITHDPVKTKGTQSYFQAASSSGH